MNETKTNPAADQVAQAADNIAHAGCRYCYVPPKLGDTVTMLCGEKKIFLGLADESSALCPMCAEIDAQVLANKGCSRCL